MTECRCTCSHFDGPHDAEARHPNPKACIHAQSFASAEQLIHHDALPETRHPYTCGGCSLEFTEKAAYDAHVALWTWHKENPVTAKWQDENGDTYFTVKPS